MQDGLRSGRLHYRYYLDEQRTLRRDDLPEAFWRGAHVQWEWSIAAYPPRTVQGVEVFLPNAGTNNSSDAAWLTAAIARLKGLPNPDRPKSKTEASRRLAAEMTKALKAGECQKALRARSIEMHYLKGRWP